MCRTKRKKNGPEKLLGHGDSMGDMIDPSLPSRVLDADNAQHRVAGVPGIVFLSQLSLLHPEALSSR